MEKQKQFHERQAGKKCRLLPVALSLFLFLLIPLKGYGDENPIAEVVQQNSKVTGTVVDANGEPVIGANVTVVGTTLGTITDIDGRFSLNANSGAKIKISFIGYKEKVVTIKKGISLNIVLEEDAQSLGEVQVVAYGVQKKVSITGAISSMKGDDLLKTPAGSLSNVLSGQITGISSVQYSGEPGADAADIYVRGVATWNNAKPLIQVDGVERDFSQIDPNEIESVTVLKDASATAVFGVRGANGVILITTKRGAEGKAKVSFSTSAGVNVRTKDLEFANSYQYASYYNMMKVNDGGVATFSDEQLETFRNHSNPLIYPDINWIDYCMNKAAFQSQHNVNISGGTSNMKYFVSAGLFTQGGMFKQFNATDDFNFDYKRYNYRANLDFDVTKTTLLSVNIGGRIETKRTPESGEDQNQLFRKLYWAVPFAGAGIVNGERVVSNSEILPFTGMDGLSSYYGKGFQTKTTNVLNVDLALNQKLDFITKGLSVKLKGAYNSEYANTKKASSSKAYYTPVANADGSISLRKYGTDSQLSYDEPDNGFSKARNWYMELALNYARKFGDHNVSAMVLFEEQYNNWDSFYAQRVMQLVGEYLIYGEEEGQIGSMGGAGDVTRQAYVGKLTYDYKGRYMVDFSFREDGSSRYPKDGRWGFFPGVSAGWRISEEPFVKELVPFLTNLKLRGSWGKMGDDGAAGTYPETAVAYNINKDRIAWFYNGILMTGVEPTAIPNPDKTWYTSKTVNLGLDFDLWNQKLSGTVEFFKRKREGLLATASTVVPGTVGANLPQENLNADQTFGWEISLNHRNRVGDVNYWVGGQISATKNRWDYRLDSQASNSMDAWRRRDVSGRNKDIWFSYEEGGRFSSYEQIRYHDLTGGGYGQGTLPGDYYYKDWNGDGIINGEDNHPMASYNLPVFNYGFVMGADWKGIDVSMNWQGAAGVYNSYDEVFTEVGPFNGGAVLDIYLDRWHTVNPSDDPFNPNTKWVSGLYPATGHSFSNAGTGIKNTSYLRLKTLEVGYTLPKTWIAKAGIQNLRIYFNAYNLLTFTGLDNIDPERPGRQGGANNNADSGILFYNYPVNRTFNIGATIKF